MKPDILGWYLISCSKAFIIVPFVFAGPEFLSAVKDAGLRELATSSNLTFENVTAALNETDGRVLVTFLGGRQLDSSSVLVLTSTLASIVVVLFAPLAGAVVDFTRHRRREIGLAYVVGTSAILLFLVGLVIGEWRVSFFAGPFIATSMDLGNVGFYAYLAEFAADEDEASVGDFAARSGMLLSSVQVVFLVLLAGTGMFLNVSQTDLTYVALSIGSVGVAALSFTGVYLLNSRPALHELPKGNNIIVASMNQLWNTTIMLFTSYHQVFKFLFGYTFLSALLTTLITISSTYLSEEIKLGSTEVAIFFLVALICGIPGAYTVERAVRKVHARSIALVAMLVWILSLALTPFLLVSAATAYLFGALWGYLLGLTYTSTRVLYTVIIPGGQEAELMGIFEFSSKILGWAPGIVFTALNETTMSLKIALGCVSVFVIPAFISFYFIDLGKADRDIRDTLRNRFHSDESLRASIAPDQFSEVSDVESTESQPK